MSWDVKGKKIKVLHLPDQQMSNQTTQTIGLARVLQDALNKSPLDDARILDMQWFLESGVYHALVFYEE